MMLANRRGWWVGEGGEDGWWAEFLRWSIGMIQCALQRNSYLVTGGEASKSAKRILGAFGALIWDRFGWCLLTEAFSHVDRAVAEDHDVLPRALLCIDQFLVRRTSLTQSPIDRCHSPPSNFVVEPHAPLRPLCCCKTAPLNVIIHHFTAATLSSKILVYHQSAAYTSRNKRIRGLA
ncbi:hypothetical protein K458DRAFT_123647 [Lentithecium fluviatile CBS 122367]|uniref:Uncharacterized protein n=1 Tax=Lentithecium fluviatile CBS 122367 TaxID=1168545 RepID=A0A6G1JG20_9PLEO|nr:hypothetical protein K458DRAFT_123647 [Lentithecium fluviatile CBS 122367]